MLVLAEEEYPALLRADFQQYYNLNIDDMGREYTHAHAATILRQLPQTSRISIAQNPDAAWSDAEWLLAQIEYNIRVLVWQNTKDGQKNINKPKPQETPAEHKAKQDRIADVDRQMVDRILGR